MNITNYAFAIFATLSALSFSYEKSITDKKQKTTVKYCGEKFLHSSILFLTASIIKYFLLQPDVVKFMTSNAFLTIIYFVFLYLPVSFFLTSIINAIAGLRELNTILFSRKKPFEEIQKLI